MSKETPSGSSVPKTKDAEPESDVGNQATSSLDEANGTPLNVNEDVKTVDWDALFSGKLDMEALKMQMEALKKQRKKEKQEKRKKEKKLADKIFKNSLLKREQTILESLSQISYDSIATIEDDLKIFEKSYNVMIDRYSKMKSDDYESLKSEMKKLKDRVHTFFEGLEDTPEQLNQKLKSIEQQYLEHQDNNKMLKVAESNLEDLINKMKTENTDFQKEDSELRSHIDRLSDTIMHLEQSLPDKNAEIDSLNIVLNEIKSENSMIKDGVQGKHEEIQSIHNAKNQEINDLSIEYDAVAAQMRQDLDDVRKIAEDYSNHFMASDKKISILEQEISVMKTNNEKLLTTKDELIQSKQQLEDDYKHQQEAFERANSRASETVNQIMELKQKLEELESLKKQNINELENIKKENSKMQGDLQSLQKTLTENSKIISDYQNKIDRLRALVETQHDHTNKSNTQTTVHPPQKLNKSVTSRETKNDAPKIDSQPLISQSNSPDALKPQQPKGIEDDKKMSLNQSKTSTITPDLRSEDDLFDDLPPLNGIIDLDKSDSDDSSSSYFVKPKPKPNPVKKNKNK